MAGTEAGGKLAAKRNLERHGADFFKRIGQMGGKNGTGHTFAHGKLDPREAGKIGGAKSSRKGIKSGMGKKRRAQRES